LIGATIRQKIYIAHPSFYEAFWFWIWLGFISFGGPTGQISIMYRELVEKKKWISNSRFLHALNYCMLLPGPEALQLAIYIGWLLHLTSGGLVAGISFVLPSACILWLLSYLYVTFGQLAWMAAMFYALKPAVVAIVACAVVRIGSKSLRNWVLWMIAAMAFMAIFFLHQPFPLVILGSIFIGWVGGKVWPDKFLKSSDQPEKAVAVIHDTQESPAHVHSSLKKTIKILLLGLSCWWIPVLFLGYLTGWENILFKEALFFSKAAMVTFGGAYSVLSYVAQNAVAYGWILPGQMIDGLGLAESTPGPLIIVLQFVGFLGGWHYPNEMNPLLSATLAALITSWCTFVPCFLWIFLGAPYIEQFRGNVALNAALSAVTAAVVGVVLNLAVWFAMQVLFTQQGAFDPIASMICLVAFLGMWYWKWDILLVVFGSALFGVLYEWLTNISIKLAAP
jgi:chromate transporter